MKRKHLIAVIVAAIFTLLTGVQAAVDIYNEMKLEEGVFRENKKAAYCIFIEIEDKTLYLLEDGKCIREYPIASGRSGLPSPIGFWKIIEKGDWGEGFGGRWMGLNVTWGTYGIHGTSSESSIGSAASHGCIRMFNADARELYNFVSVGTPVVIANGVLGPFGNGFSDIEVGDRGADVLAVQIRLKKLGFYKGTMDGIYTDDLKHALHNFQRKNGLEAKNTITREDYLKMGFRDFE